MSKKERSAVSETNVKLYLNSGISTKKHKTMINFILGRLQKEMKKRSVYDSQG